MLSSLLPTGVVALAAAGVAAATVAAPAPAPPPAPPPAAAGTPSWGWPVDPPRVLRGFEDVGRYEAGHRGVDLAADPGRAVVAVAAGTVSFAGPVAGRGVVVVLHPDGTRTTYEPLEAAVRPGEQVRAGEVLGALAAAPRHCAVPCLHLGLRAGETYLDPLARLRAAAPVLLPLGRS
ncbi:murein hydrolase activator EnvC family protein [Kineococcus sp. SYSU DK002]|uniref:murein hydrolase activator EnvC family protein n=1 Tax=Kineococcus sp. SYSU DK002 TaxID=3383123 RepID=UPI003D7C5199